MTREIPEWADINEVRLRGRLGKDAETKTTLGGMVIVSLNLATSERWKDKKSGEQKEITEWHQVEVKFNDVLVNAAMAAKKSQRVRLLGKKVTRTWKNAQDETRYATNIEVTRFGEFEILPDDREGKSPPAPRAATNIDNLDDEIPF